MLEQATFAAGCFWGVETAFRNLDGVKNTAVGYMGGMTEKPAYENVCTGTTGHAEVVQVEFDTETVTYDDLLNLFWNAHNPTTLNRQGPDIGTQYRSGIFYHNETQLAAAKLSLEKVNTSGKFSQPVVTEISPAGEFNRAEEYHQQYLEKRGIKSCHL